MAALQPDRVATMKAKLIVEAQSFFSNHDHGTLIIWVCPVVFPHEVLHSSGSFILLCIRHTRLLCLPWDFILWVHLVRPSRFHLHYLDTASQVYINIFFFYMMSPLKAITRVRHQSRTNNAGVGWPCTSMVVPSGHGKKLATFHQHPHPPHPHRHHRHHRQHHQHRLGQDCCNGRGLPVAVAWRQRLPANRR
jgi:hypothetical protein